ncbi:MAG: glycosyl hydrolase family protein [Nitrospiraceae bacterium]|nr:MAG: glycosyl hydrolase family protein [Nitrospiraceae bacterium]
MMRIRNCLLFAIAGFFVMAVYTEPSEPEDTPYFREDFSAPKLSVFQWGEATFSLYNFRADPAMVSNSEGVNYLRLGESKSSVYPSGFIYTQERFSYGSYSARMKVSDMPGAVASFFACSEIAKIFTDATHDEIDFELITAEPHSVLLSTWYVATGMEGDSQTPTHNSFLWKDPSFDIRQWHVYRFDWYPERVDFFIDSRKVWTSTKAVPKRELQISLNIYTIDTWKEVQFPPKGEVVQMTDWVEYREISR